MAARRDAARRAPSQPLTEAEFERNAKLLARVLYRDLRSKGFSQSQIIVVVQEFLACVIAEMDTRGA